MTNQTGRDASGRRTVDLLATAPGTRLAAIFSPEHGITGEANAEVPHGRDPDTGVPEPVRLGQATTAADLKDVTLLVFDIQDGVRYYTYLTTLVYVMEEAARHRIPCSCWIAPIHHRPLRGRSPDGSGSRLVHGAAPDPGPDRHDDRRVRRMAAAERKDPVADRHPTRELGAEPLVRRDRPALGESVAQHRSVTQALLYAGIGLLEATNLSVGRGTEAPFEIVGAPGSSPKAWPPH